MNFTTGCTLLTRPGVGEIHLHYRWWRPQRITEMLYIPEGTDTTHTIPQDRYEEFAADANTHLKAMAIIRR